MPDPQDMAMTNNTLEKEEQMATVVGKALKKRKRKRRTKKLAYDKLAALVPSVATVLQNSTYGASAGGFKPSVPTDGGNGSSTTPAGPSTVTKAGACWPAPRRNVRR